MKFELKVNTLASNICMIMADDVCIGQFKVDQNFDEVSFTTKLVSSFDCIKMDPVACSMQTSYRIQRIIDNLMSQ